MRSSFVLALFTFTRSFACSTVEGDSITASDLARANSVFAALDPQMAMAPSPLAGAVRVLHASELLTLARRHSLAVQDLVEDACFERLSEPLTLALLEPILDRQFAGQPVEIADFSRVRIPLEADRKFEITGAASNVIRGRVTYSGGHSVIFWVRLKAAHDAHPLLSQSDGIERGESVNVEVRSGAARLAFASTAESSGHMGEVVLVRNPQNGKLFQAKVQSKGTVLVQR